MVIIEYVYKPKHACKMVKILCHTDWYITSGCQMCGIYANEINTKFNVCKNHMVLFKGQQCKDSQRTLIMYGGNLVVVKLLVI